MVVVCRKSLGGSQQQLACTVAQGPQSSREEACAGLFVGWLLAWWRWLAVAGWLAAGWLPGCWLAGLDWLGYTLY